ncbi:MAG: WXG100 family type VII secretion target [Frankia sp.]
MAQDGVIQVNFASLEAGAQTLGTASQTLAQHISDLEAAMRPMLSTWDGKAMEAYVPRQDGWKSAAGVVQTDIINLKRAVDNAHELYSTNENANAGMLGA